VETQIKRDLELKLRAEMRADMIKEVDARILALTHQQQQRPVPQPAKTVMVKQPPSAAASQKKGKG
jgi:hypothetical protein